MGVYRYDDSWHPGERAEGVKKAISILDELDLQVKNAYKTKGEKVIRVMNVHYPYRAISDKATVWTEGPPLTKGSIFAIPNDAAKGNPASVSFDTWNSKTEKFEALARKNINDFVKMFDWNKGDGQMVGEIAALQPTNIPPHIQYKIKQAAALKAAGKGGIFTNPDGIGSMTPFKKGEKTGTGHEEPKGGAPQKPADKTGMGGKGKGTTK